MSGEAERRPGRDGEVSTPEAWALGTLNGEPGFADGEPGLADPEPGDPADLDTGRIIPIGSRSSDIFGSMG